MRLTRKTPAGLESANTRGGGYRFHNHLDASCEIDSEPVPHYGNGSFEHDLYEDMAWRKPEDLDRRYRELVFSRVSSKPLKRDGWDYVASAGKGWTVARWRTIKDL